MNITVGQKVYFEGEKLPMKVMAMSERFAVCTRKLNRIQDAELLWHEVEMQAYYSFTEAYKALKDTPVYTILDFKNKKRGPHNMIISPYDFEDKESMQDLIKDLESGETELSRRHSIDLNIKL